MRTVGEILSEARKNKGLSVEEVEDATKIRKKNIIALESSDWTGLPPTFIKGLLKNYASYLGLDEKRVLAFFRREFDEKKAIQPSPPNNLRKKFLLTPTIVSILLVAAAVFGISVYLFSQYQSFTAPPKLEIAEPADNIKITSNEVNVVGQTWSDADLKINGQSVQVSQGGAFSVAITLKEGINVLTITATNRFGKVSTVKRSIVVEKPKPERSVLSSEDNILKLRLQITSKSTFVFVEVDGKKVFEGLMVPESSADFEAREKIKIRTEDAGNTKVIIDGQELILGEEGEKVEKEFTANR